MTLSILVNRHGGGVADGALDRLRDALVAAGLDARIELLDADAIADRAGNLARNGAQIVAVAGGDGTVGAAAGALAGTKTALGILPLGTLNHLARDLAIPFNLDKAVAVLATGNRHLIDLAEVNGRTFVNNSAIGLYPLMVIDRDRQQKRLGRSKRLAMVVASLRTLMRFHDQRLTLRVNDEKEGRLDTPLLFVGNNDYRLAFPAAGRRESLSDGHLCVLVMRKKGAFGLIAATLRALVGLTRDDDMVRLDGVQTLEVRSSRKMLTLSADGETLRLESPLTFTTRPAALTVIAPATQVPARPLSSTANSQSPPQSARRSRRG